MLAGEFFTEPEFASSMRQTFEAWYMFGMLSLKVSPTLILFLKETCAIYTPSPLQFCFCLSDQACASSELHGICLHAGRNCSPSDKNSTPHTLQDTFRATFLILQTARTSVRKLELGVDWQYCSE